MAMAEDNIFEPVSGNAALEELTKTLREDSPRSACIHNMILMHAKGYVDLFNVYIQKSNPCNILLVEKSDYGIISVYCPEPNEDQFIDALNKTTLITWLIFNCALYVSETICEKLSMLIINRTHAEVYIKEGEYHIYDPKEDTMELEVPAGYTLRKLGHASAIQMEAIGEPLFVCPNLNKYRELHITAPNCTVYRTEGEPNKVINFDQDDVPEAVEEGISLAWACSNKEGQLGIVCTNEDEILNIIKSKKNLDHMEKVLTHLVVNACTLRMVKEGFIAHSYIYHGLSEVPKMPNWRHVGYICNIFSRFTDSSTDEDCTGTDVDCRETYVTRDEMGGYRMRTNASFGGAPEVDWMGEGQHVLGGAGQEMPGGAGEDEEELDGSVEEELGGIEDEELGEVYEEELGGMDEEELDGVDEEELEGTEEEELEEIDEQELSGNVKEERVERMYHEETSETDDEELCGTDDEEMWVTDDEELCETDVEVADTDVELVVTEKDKKAANHKGNGDAD